MKPLPLALTAPPTCRTDTSVTTGVSPAALRLVATVTHLAVLPGLLLLLATTPLASSAQTPATVALPTTGAPQPLTTPAKLLPRTPAAVLAPALPKLSPQIQEIAPTQVERFLVQHPSTQIIDLRSEDERRTRGFILNSTNLEYQQGQKTLDALAQLDKNQPCLLYCAIGGRAKLIAPELERLGFKEIILLQGGFNAWTASGQAVAGLPGTR